MPGLAWLAVALPLAGAALALALVGGLVWEALRHFGAGGAPSPTAADRTGQRIALGLGLPLGLLAVGLAAGAGSLLALAVRCWAFLGVC